MISKYPAETATLATGTLGLGTSLGAAAWVIQDARAGREELIAAMAKSERHLKKDMAKLEKNLSADINNLGTNLGADISHLEKDFRADMAKLREFVGHQVSGLHEENMFTQTLVLRVTMKTMKAIEDDKEDMREQAEKFLQCVKVGKTLAKILEAAAAQKKL